MTLEIESGYSQIIFLLPLRKVQSYYCRMRSAVYV